MTRLRCDEFGTFGRLAWNGKQLVTLERTEDIIPAGAYEVIVDYSEHLEEPTPRLLAVPGRTQIRIHNANFQTQLRGCIAVGLSEASFDGQEGVANSRAALAELMGDLNTDMNPSLITIADA